MLGRQASSGSPSGMDAAPAVGRAQRHNPDAQEDEDNLDDVSSETLKEAVSILLRDRLWMRSGNGQLSIGQRTVR